MELIPSSVRSRYLSAWAALGRQWGISRKAAMIVGVLYFAGRPLSATEITREVQISRSTFSAGLNELLGPGFVTRFLPTGSRQEHFECRHDACSLFRVHLVSRTRNEADAAVEGFGACVDSMKDTKTNRDALSRMEELIDLFQLVQRAYGRISADLTEKQNKP